MNTMTDPQQTIAAALRNHADMHPQTAAGISSSTGFGKLIHNLIYMPGWLQVIIILGGAAMVLLLWRLDSRDRLNPETGEQETNGTLHIVYLVLIVLLALMVIVTLLAVLAGTYLMTVDQTF